MTVKDHCAEDGSYFLDGVVVSDADTNAGCKVRALFYDAEITLRMPLREIKAWLTEQTTAGAADPPQLD